LSSRRKHHALAAVGRNGRHAHVDRAPGDAQRNAPVLRQALLGDVERSHHLDARDHGGMQAPAGLDHVAQGAVDAVAHQRARLEDLQVHVGGALAHGLREQRVDEPDDRGVVLALEEVGHLGQRFGELGEVDRVAHVLDDGLGGGRLARVGERQALLELLGAEQHLAQGLAGHAAHLGERRGRGIRADPHLERAVDHASGEHALRLGEGVGQQSHRLRVEVAGVHGSLQRGRHCVLRGLFCCSSSGGIGWNVPSGMMTLGGSLTPPCWPRMYS
jgi:hypothetical protein